MSMLQITSPPQASAEVLVNTNFQALEHQGVYGYNGYASSGLTWAYFGGRWGGFSVSSGTFTLTGSSTNYLVVERATGAHTASTSSTNWNNTSAYARVYKLTTSGGAVTAIEDHRSGPNGVHGGAASAAADLDGLSDVVITTPATGNLLRFNGTSWVNATAGASGALVNFTDGVNSSTPNATVPVVSLAATNAATNTDAAIVPKGTGAFSLAVADNSSTGGNKRGVNAVDLQTSRGANTQVASGTTSFLAGNGSTASGTNAVAIAASSTSSGTASAVVGGSSHSATQQAAGVFGGESNSATATRAWAGGGTSNAASGTNSATLGGSSNAASGTNSLAVGQSSAASGAQGFCHGYQAKDFGVIGADVHGVQCFSAVGDAQVERRVLALGTTNATPNDLTADNTTTASSTNQIVLQNGSIMAFRGQVVVRQPSTGDSAAWLFSGAIKRGANAAATALMASVTPTLIAADSGAAAWSLAITANTTLGCLQITATGESSKTLRWVAGVECTKVG